VFDPSRTASSVEVARRSLQRLAQQNWITAAGFVLRTLKRRQARHERRHERRYKRRYKRAVVSLERVMNPW
jgi:hypothetical protein